MSALRRHEFINTTSVDAMLALYAQVCARVRLEPESDATFGCRSGRAALGPLILLADRFEGAFQVWTEDERDDLLMLTLPIERGRGSVAIGGEAHELVAAKRGIIGTPSRPHAFTLAPEYEAMHVAFSRADLQSTVAAMAGLDHLPHLEFEPSIDLGQGAGAALRRLVEFAVAEVDADRGAWLSPIVAARYAEVITAQVLTGLSHNCSAMLQAPERAAEPRFIRRAAAYVDAHAAEPLSVADIARAVGISVRALQAGFLKHRRMSPMEFLRDRRLDLAHRRLLTPSPESVTDIAIACGFSHLGRFSQAYRARFGETPSRTRIRMTGK
jgi:AraC-like DNA-binding protein